MSNMEMSAEFGMVKSSEAKVNASGLRIPLNRAEKNTEYTVLKI